MSVAITNIYSLLCRNIYQKLGGVVSDDQRNMYHQRVDEITPNLRYCAYNIGGMPTDVSELIKLRTNALGSDMLSSKIDVCEFKIFMIL